MKKFINSLRSNCGILAMLAVILMAAPALTSCDDDDDKYIPYCPGVANGMVTVKTADDSSVYLQLDDSTTLYPLNMTEHPFGGKQVRAFVSFNTTTQKTAGYTYSVTVNWIDSVLTKPTVETLGSRNDEVYGSDPVEIIKGFPTVCEDNYLTLAIASVWGKKQVKHFINLVTGVNPDDPYEVELRQNAYGDTIGHTSGTTVAFSLAKLPPTGGKTVKLKVRYQSFTGEKTAEFDYRSR